MSAILRLSNRLIPAEGKGNWPNNGLFLDSETLLLLLPCLFRGLCYSGVLILGVTGAATTRAH